MKKIFCLLVFVIFILYGNQSASAFSVILKSGKRIEGVWISETTSTILIRDKTGAYLTFKKASLDLKAMSIESRIQIRSNEIVKPSIQLAKGNQLVTRTKQIARDNPEKVTKADSVKIVPTENVPVPSLNQAPSNRPISFYLVLSNVFDSNINHDVEDLDSVGLVYGLGARYVNRASRPTFAIDYNIARHSYTDTEVWDRISHNLSGTYERRLSSRFSLEADAEISIKGSTEDREVGNQFILNPELKFRIDPSNRLLLFATQRWKRYDQDVDRNASNYYLGAGFEHRFGEHKVDASYRFEKNNSHGPRHQYVRWTYQAAYTMPLNQRNWLSFELRYRPQKYLKRLVEIDVDNGPDFEELRSDRRWIFTVDSLFELNRHFAILPSYKFETRSSNDLDKEFTAHMPSVTMKYQW